MEKCESADWMFPLEEEYGNDPIAFWAVFIPSQRTPDNTNTMFWQQSVTYLPTDTGSPFFFCIMDSSPLSFAYRIQSSQMFLHQGVNKLKRPNDLEEFHFQFFLVIVNILFILTYYFSISR